MHAKLSLSKIKKKSRVILKKIATVPTIQEFMVMMDDDPDAVQQLYDQAQILADYTWSEYVTETENPDKNEFNTNKRSAMMLIKNIEKANEKYSDWKENMANQILTEKAIEAGVLPDLSESDRRKMQKVLDVGMAAEKKLLKNREKIEKQKKALEKTMEKKKQELLQKLDRKLSAVTEKLTKSQKCKALGKIAVTINGTRRCVDKHYKSRVKCRSKKRKGYVFSKSKKRCVKSNAKKSAMCKKRGLVYDKESGKCRKSAVKSRAKTAAEWKEKCKSEGKYLTKRKSGGYGCRKTAKKSRTLSDRRLDCVNSGRTFAKNNDGKWICRASRKPGRKSTK